MARAVRLSPRDRLALGLRGLTARPARAALSALGIAVGVATLVVVTGIPASGQRALMAELSALGTGTLVAQGTSVDGDPVPLVEGARGMAGRIGPVTAAGAVGNTGATVRRSDVVEASSGVGISVLAVDGDLLGPVHGQVASGRFLTAVTERFPTAVLGHQAAAWLGITQVDPAGPGVQVRIGPHWFTVVGVLAPTPLAPAIEQAVLVGWPAARDVLGFDGHPTVVYVTAREDAVEDVRAVLPATLDPRLPGTVQVSRPSDALAAKRSTARTFDGLLVGLAGVALLVGGIGVANTMVVSVLERRGEIGLRRALGATRGHVRAQFLTEAVLLSAVGGAGGTVLGVLVTVGYATSRAWPVALDPAVVAGGAAGAVVVGALAGLYPAVRAARVPPTRALAG